MKKVTQFIKGILGGKAHANHADIKGRKSGGVRDGNKVDWYEPKKGVG